MTISPVPTVFGAPSPSDGGPQPFIPTPGAPRGDGQAATHQEVAAFLRELDGLKGVLGRQ